MTSTDATAPSSVSGSAGFARAALARRGNAADETLEQARVDAGVAR
jgi:hypothetical protein